jgi:hypothetical protein
MYEPWRTALVREGALPALLMYAQQEEPQRAAYALELLHHVTQVIPPLAVSVYRLASAVHAYTSCMLVKMMMHATGSNGTVWLPATHLQHAECGAMCCGFPQARHNQDALTQLIAVQQAVPVLAGMISTVSPTVLLGVIKLLGALASAHEEGRLQVR